jgi:hypothetical protein
MALLEEDPPTLVSDGSTAGEVSSDALKRLFDAFIACRTTFDDLSSRVAALGQEISGPVIAAHLTGESRVSDLKHNVLAAAINARLRELSLPATAPYRQETESPKGAPRRFWHRRSPVS